MIKNINSFIDIETISYARGVAALSSVAISAIVHRSLISPWVEKNCLTTTAKWAAYSIEVLVLAGGIGLLIGATTIHSIGLGGLASLAIGIYLATKNSTPTVNWQSDASEYSPTSVRLYGRKSLTQTDLNNLPITLECLDLYNCSFDGPVSFQRFKSLKNLEISCSDENFKNEFVNAVQGLSLRSLTITSTVCFDTPIPNLIPCLQKMPLEVLDIRHTLFPASGLKNLRNELKSLFISDYSPTNEDLTYLASLKLEKVVLGGNIWIHHIWDGLKEFTKYSNFQLSKDDLVRFLRSHPNLEDVTLFNCENYSDEVLKELAKLTKLKSLHLEHGCHQFTEQGFLELLPLDQEVSLSIASKAIPQALKDRFTYLRTELV